MPCVLLEQILPICYSLNNALRIRKDVWHERFRDISAPFLEGAQKYFIIPVYQRKYDWKIDNCRQLYEDFKRMLQEILAFEQDLKAKLQMN